MTETDWKLINKRKSCALLTHEQMAEGKIPTTPTSSAVIAGIQVQEMLKLLHGDRNLPTLAGKCYVFNGLTHDSYVVEYQRKDDCMSHDTYDSINEMPWSVRSFTLGELVGAVKADMGEAAVVDFDRDFASVAACSCGEHRELFTPVHRLRAESILCPNCGSTMDFKLFHSLDGTEIFLDKTVGEIGIPPLHIVSGRVGTTSKYYEFSVDESEIFSGFNQGGQNQ
jgi:adenylyltransferase/sulfurtransferase